MRKRGDFYKIAAEIEPSLLQWIGECREHQRMANAIDEISRDNGLDPKSATVGDFLKLGEKR